MVKEIMKEEVTSIQDYVAILQRRKWSLILPAVLVFAVAIASALIMPKTYQSTSTILIEEQEIPREFVASTVTGYADQRLQMINQRVMVSSKLMDVINRYNLYPEKRKSSTIEEIVTLMRKDILFKTISADISDKRSGRESAATIAFSLSYDGKNPEVVQQVATALTSLFLEENLRAREQQSSGTFKFLEEEAKGLKEQITRIDAEVSDFKKRNLDALPELLSINLQALDGFGRDIDRMNDVMRSLKERKSYYQSQLDIIPTDADNQDRTLLRELQARLVQLESRYSSKYPEVIKTRAEIARLEARIGSSGGGNTRKSGSPGKSDNPAYVNLASQLAGVQSEIDSVNRQIGDLNRKKEDYRRRIENSPKVDETYKRLLSERNNTQVKYDDLIRKTLEAKISHGLEREQMGERFNLIEPAKLPEKPVKPNIPAILLIGLVLGIGAGVGVASIREASDRSVRSAKLLAAETSLPVLASIPEIVTWGDKKRERTRRVALGIAMVVLVIAGIAVFHFLVMDLDILWAKVLRRVNV